MEIKVKRDAFHLYALLIRIRKSDFYLGIFTVWFVTDILQDTTLETIAGIDVGILFFACECVTLFFLMVQILFFWKYEQMEIIAIGLITAVIVIATLCSSDLTLMGTWIFIVAAKQMRFEDIILRAYRILLIMIPFVALCCALGLLADDTLYRGIVLRHSLGFNHPNTLGQRIFLLVACHLYLHRERIRFRDVLLSLAAVVFAYVVPYSQTAYISVLVLLAGIMIDCACARLWAAASKFYRCCLIGLAAMCNIVSVFWSICGVGSGTIVAAIDGFLSRRFSVCHRVYQLYGITLWGNKVVTGKNYISGWSEWLYMDNGYMTLLLRFGILVYMIFSLAFLANMVRVLRQSEGVLLVILFTFALYGIMERNLFALTNNTFLPMLAALLYERRSVERKAVLRMALSAVKRDKKRNVSGKTITVDRRPGL